MGHSYPCVTCGEYHNEMQSIDDCIKTLQETKARLRDQLIEENHIRCRFQDESVLLRDRLAAALEVFQAARKVWTDLPLSVRIAIETYDDATKKEQPND